MPLYLASQSPRRAELLKKAGISFVPITNNFDESQIVLDPTNIEGSLKILTQKKATSVTHTPKDWVLSADTILYFEDQFIGKPNSLDTAQKTLKKLSNNTHQVWTATCLWHPPTQKFHHHIDHSEVTFHPLTDAMIQNYIQTHSILDKAGSYAIQDIGETFVKKIKGDPETIIGLPVNQLKNIFRNYDIL